MTSKHVKSLVTLSLMILSGVLWPAGAGAQIGSETAPKIRAVSYVTWWSHDATGYHPAVLLRLANESAQDLTGTPIKFQAQFTDLRNGYQTIAREEERREFQPSSDISIVLRAPKPFELPIDKFLWPQLECKVMCRIGNVGDEATQTLLIAKMEEETMADEEASEKLHEIAAPARAPQRHKHLVEHGTEVEKPLVASALPLSAAIHPKVPHPLNPASEHTLSHFLAGAPRLAGLGDDFYDFDQTFGKYVEYDAKESHWTWVRYGHSEPPFALYVAARPRTSKADLIVAVVPADEVPQPDNIMPALAKLLAGKLKNQALDALSHTVSYLPAGRIQLTTAHSPSYKMAFISPRGTSLEENSYILILSRLPGDYHTALSDNAKRISMLHFLIPVLGDAEPD